MDFPGKTCSSTCNIIYSMFPLPNHLLVAKHCLESLKAPLCFQETKHKLLNIWTVCLDSLNKNLSIKRWDKSCLNIKGDHNVFINIFLTKMNVIYFHCHYRGFYTSTFFPTKRQKIDNLWLLKKWLYGVSPCQNDWSKITFSWQTCDERFFVNIVQ